VCISFHWHRGGAVPNTMCHSCRRDMTIGYARRLEYEYALAAGRGAVLPLGGGLQVVRGRAALSVNRDAQYRRPDFVNRRVMFSENIDWEGLYRQTVLELDARRMAERIEAIRQAIARRLQDIEHNDHHPEKRQLENVLKALSTLEHEARRW
jgi:hypothetical protein